MRTGRRLWRLEQASSRQFLAAMSEAERIDYLRLVSRLLDDGWESASPEDRERAVALVLLVTGEHLCA